jgi:hypothetical protein
MPNELVTASQVIDALGGTTKVAKLCDRSPQSVTNWRAANRLPADTFLVISEELVRIGQTAPPSLWGIKEPRRP